ncbi:MAG TPA: carbohydrate kinase [Microscillaceae bacterium]|nr:carbohydrate kinase [Microscillaceae bacterium]
MEGVYFLGYDLGSSSVKASLIEAKTGVLVASAISPDVEMEIISPHKGWAEQHPEVWWSNVIKATHQLLKKSQVAANHIKAIGISYQMHGLVLVNKDQQVLRPSIIWCDSRAVSIGEDAFRKLGEIYCLERLLNSPGNFTASKLKWVKENEPAVYDQIDKVMLPGDYLAMKMTDQVMTTVPGLSEGIMWDYQKQVLPERLFKLYEIAPELIPEIVPTFSKQGVLTSDTAKILGLAVNTPITYRAGDQPNNAFSLNVLNPGEIATTAGTSGVIYGVVDKPVSDKHSRVNTFVHSNYTNNTPRYGVLLCVNGTGILNSWLRKNLSLKGHLVDYNAMNDLAKGIPIGSEGLSVLPFGNGAERMLKNTDIGAGFHRLDLNRHTNAHLCRAVQEGIVFALGYGFQVFRELGLQSNVIRAGHANMFLSDIFCEAFANITNTTLELYNTDGAQGAARAAGVGANFYQDFEEAFDNLQCIKTYEPNPQQQPSYQQAFEQWKGILETQLAKL